MRTVTQRVAGMIPWDYDVDVACVVKDPQEMSEKIAPGLVEFMKAQGHRPLVMPHGRAVKIAPRKCAACNLHPFTEAKSRIAEASAKKGKTIDRAQLSSLASKASKKSRQSTAFGRNVVDVEMLVLQPNGSARLHNYNATVHAFGIKHGVRFGNLFVPVPVSGTGQSWRKLVEPVLQAMYPSGFKVPMYRNPVTGKATAVPRSAPRLQRPLVPACS